jgi:hypothetical protein
MNGIDTWDMYGVRTGPLQTIYIHVDGIPGGQGDSEGEENELPTKKGKTLSVPWELPRDHEGWPILPLELSLPLPQLKEVLRSFLTITYRKDYPPSV